MESALNTDLNADSNSVIEVEIFSDVVCPWCYIGKRRWEKALQMLADARGADVLDRINVVYRPYQLDPTAPTTPSPVLQAYAKKFGGEEKAQQIINTVTETAAGEGLAFRMDIAQRANTRDAHRLLNMALADGKQAELKERLLQAYFIEGADISNQAVLAGMAADVGMRAYDTLEALESDHGVELLEAELQSAAEIGVTAVPTFVFNGEFGLPGAQDPEVFVRVLTKLLDA
jgi:predicted DsbA family dithiol-disulfide isomerase